MCISIFIYVYPTSRLFLWSFIEFFSLSHTSSYLYIIDDVSVSCHFIMASFSLLFVFHVSDSWFFFSIHVFSFVLSHAIWFLFVFQSCIMSYLFSYLSLFSFCFSVVLGLCVLSLLPALHLYSCLLTSATRHSEWGRGVLAAGFAGASSHTLFIIQIQS